MNLSEYLKRPEVTPLTLAEKVVAANAFELVEYVKIEGATRKTAVETTNLMYDTTERLAVFEPAPELEAQYHDAARDIAKKILKAFNNLYNPEFYINLQDPEVKTMFDWSVPFGVLTQAEYLRINKAGTRTAKPFENVVEQDIINVESLGETVGTTHYGEMNSSQPFHVRLNTTKTIIEIALAEAVAYDTVFKVYVSKKSGITGEWVEAPNPVSVNNVLVKGNKEIVFELNQYIDRHTQYRVVSNRNDAFDVLVTSANKY